ncbi:MAG: YebC/PmpR family DNA-binding transcriptional regulator [Spirochaetia bacterium]|nr:YebC/PmpR family DNA-binding transcriptional regulator [Spirochaetia bacterium]
MAGHSKWANIKHRKQAADAKRGKIFTRLAKEITVSAKLGGGDENSNPRLRAAILKARESNVPKDNIERAVKKGTGELESDNYEELVYEGYAPGGIAIIIEVLTDKKTRTVPEIKNILSKAGGSMAESGSVSYLFDHKGVILIKGENINEEELLEQVVECGAEDFEKDEENIYVIKSAKEDFHAVLEAFYKIIETKGWEILESELQYVPKTQIALDVDKGGAVMKLIENLENHDDVQNVFSNLEISEELISG